MVQIVCTGKGAAMALPKILAQVQAFAQTKTPSVLYLGTPSYDREDIFNIQTMGFRNANCPITKMDLSEIPDSKATGVDVVYPTMDQMQKCVDEADVIQVSGGNTLYAIKRWQELGMADILRSAADKIDGPVFCGGSAGAICWFEMGNSDSMNPASFLNPLPTLTEEEKNDWDYICINGLSIIKALCVPHYDVIQHNGFLRADASESMVKEHADYPCIGIDEEAAFVVDGDIVSVIEGGRNAKVYRKLYDSKRNEFKVLTMVEEKQYSLSDLGIA
jgi:dipeptidase E